jgi:hypothetical protein
MCLWNVAAVVAGRLVCHRAAAGVVGTARGLVREVVRSAKEAKKAQQLLTFMGEMH